MKYVCTSDDGYVIGSKDTVELYEKILEKAKTPENIDKFAEIAKSIRRAYAHYSKVQSQQNFHEMNAPLVNVAAIEMIQLVQCTNGLITDLENTLCELDGILNSKEEK